MGATGTDPRGRILRLSDGAATIPDLDQILRVARDWAGDLFQLWSLPQPRGSRRSRSSQIKDHRLKPVPLRSTSCVGGTGFSLCFRKLTREIALLLAAAELFLQRVGE